MNLDEFIKKYDGKFLEVAGSAYAKNQCVDLANGYIRDVLGLPIIEWTNACDFPEKGGDKYEYIENTPLGVPEKGDLIIWGASLNGGYGHIAVFVEGGVGSFRSFDQNYPTNSPCHIQGHYYKNVIGWMRKKGTTMDQDLQTDANNWRALMEALHVTSLDVEEVVKKIDKGNDIQTDSNNWKELTKLLGMESVESITSFIKKLQIGNDCTQVLEEAETKWLQERENLKQQHKLQMDLLKKQIVALNALSSFEAFKLWIKKIFGRG